MAASFTLEFLLLYPVLYLTTASRRVLFLYAAPFSAALGAQIFLPTERLGIAWLSDLLLAFASVAAAFADSLPDGGSLIDNAMCLVADGVWGVTTIMVKASPSLSRAASTKILFLQFAGSAAVPFLPFWLLGEVQFGILADVALLGKRATWGLLIGLIAIAAGMWLVDALLKHVAE